MMRIGLLAAANEAGLLGNIAKMLAVTIAPRCRNDEHALVDAAGLIEVAVSVRELLMGYNKITMSPWSSVVCTFRGFRRCELRQPVFKSLFHKLGVGRCKTVLGGERLLR